MPTITPHEVEVTGGVDTHKDTHTGRVVVWLGARRATGRGGASSGLAWDVTVDTPG
jgi:hypothetical protein